MGMSVGKSEVLLVMEVQEVTRGPREGNAWKSNNKR